MVDGLPTLAETWEHVQCRGRKKTAVFLQEGCTVTEQPTILEDSVTASGYKPCGMFYLFHMETPTRLCSTFQSLFPGCFEIEGNLSLTFEWSTVKFTCLYLYNY